MSLSHDEPLDWDDSVRESAPTLPAMWLDEFVGSDVLLKLIRFRLEGTKRRKEPLPHHVFSGIRGIWKRTLAQVVATELGTEFQQADSRLMKGPVDVLPLLTNAGYGSVLMLSNIDALKASCASFLEPAVSNFRAEITLGDGLNARTVIMQLQPFTLRESGKCVRCGSRIRLEFDHIVPVSKGGSNTARNIELLCETCNRRKGPSVALFD